MNSASWIQVSIAGTGVLVGGWFINWAIASNGLATVYAILFLALFIVVGLPGYAYFRSKRKANIASASLVGGIAGTLPFFPLFAYIFVDWLQSERAIFVDKDDALFFLQSLVLFGGLGLIHGVAFACILVALSRARLSATRVHH